MDVTLCDSTFKCNRDEKGEEQEIGKRWKLEEIFCNNMSVSPF